MLCIDLEFLKLHNFLCRIGIMAVQVLSVQYHQRQAGIKGLCMSFCHVKQCGCAAHVIWFDLL